jgi:hypothetical protein
MKINSEGSPSYLDLHLEIDSEGRLRTKLYDKRDDFNVPIVNFPFICKSRNQIQLFRIYFHIRSRFVFFLVLDKNREKIRK